MIGRTLRRWLMGNDDSGRLDTRLAVADASSVVGAAKQQAKEIKAVTEAMREELRSRRNGNGD